MKRSSGVDRASSSGPGTENKLNPIGALLRKKHPELFDVAPRPGGFVRRNVVLRATAPPAPPAPVDAPRDARLPASKEKKTSSQSTSLRGTRAANVANEIAERNVLFPCSDVREPSKKEERDHVVRMCSIAISTVMLLAQGTYKNVTLEHLKHTEEYFRGLKQEDGYPRNVGQLMQVLANLKKAGRVVTPPSDEDGLPSDEDDTGTITDLID